MKIKPLLVCALLGVLPPLARSETVIKILHIQTNPQILAIWEAAAQTYESAHPGVKVEFDYLENQAFKAKLPTLLQSKDLPSAFHSWGGGVMYEQVGSGICQDITKPVTEGGFKDTFYSATIENFTVKGKIYGVPNDVGPVVLWYNKELCQKAGVDRRKFKQWNTLLTRSKSVKQPALRRWR